MAVVKRLWSLADKILSNHKMEMTPLVFEALMFLKTNSKYSNEHTVRQAMRINKSEKVQSRLLEDEANSS